MKLDNKQQEVRKNIGNIQNAITVTIDKLCEESNYQITYAEINAALIDMLRSNLGYELKKMWQKEQM